MKLTVKTLQGVAFPLDAELTDAVSAVKQKIEELQKFPVSQQKLIHAGKVLKDDSTLAEYNVKENDFLVVMVTKPKAAKPSAAAPDAAPTSTPAAAAAAASPAAAAPASAAPNTSSASSSTSPAVSTPSAAPATTAASSSSGEGSNVVSDEQMSATVQQLVDMGFPEDQVRSALRAAFNNPERAVEYLMTGIPEQAAAPAQTAVPSSGASAGSDDVANSLEALRNHPQFDALRQLVQSNPAALPAVLQQIGAQSPELLRLIHQNQDRFVQMLNEPIGTREAGSAPSSGSGAGAAPFDLGMGGNGAMPTPQQIQQLVDSLTPEQQAQMAAQMGMSPEQLRGLSQMLSNLPPGAMEQMMASMGGGAGLEGIGGGAGAGAGGHRIMLSEEEAAAVDRLCEMGFERTDVIQAYLACDKNEALAANFLMDSGDNFGGGAAGGAGGQGDDNEDIYG
uniref:UV excision repair protein RAD23 n=1 Tax=Phytophthora infestans TaxID=4787 RepID=A0A8B0T0Q0_PHYIN|nr:UV excision repair protein RAD23 [Phytophthora infestans]QTX15996.1 UV excision repair protein RAD23 [Phytophthora infestans]QTX16003.1 UV excision repair protein RAD23 [Phytophthora infestans]QTX16060.1 UV excision repair protein RAD23 [Phytophthora infestans]QTX16070.1 UV excision repair protein RAD23 [Phytophthora infestans]